MSQTPGENTTDKATPDSVVLEEEIDPNYTPTREECLDYGKWLGMSFPEDEEFLWIARDGLKAPLPEHWKPLLDITMATAQNGQDSVVLEEEIDPDYSPTREECLDYGKWLGMSFPEDEELLWIAREGLKAPLPEHWKPCRTLDTNEISSWDHPCDSFYRNLYEEEKARRNLRHQPWITKEDNDRHRDESVEVRKIVEMQRSQNDVDPVVKNRAEQLRREPGDLVTRNGDKSRGGPSDGNLGLSRRASGDAVGGLSLNKHAVLPGIAKPAPRNHGAPSPAPDAARREKEESTYESERSTRSESSRREMRQMSPTLGSLRQGPQEGERRRKSLRSEPATIVGAPNVRSVETFEAEERVRQQRSRRDDESSILRRPSSSEYEGDGDDLQVSPRNEAHDTRRSYRLHDSLSDEEEESYSSRFRKPASRSPNPFASRVHDHGEEKNRLDDELMALRQEHDEKLKDEQAKFEDELEDLRYQLANERKQKQKDHQKKMDEMDENMRHFQDELEKTERKYEHDYEGKIAEMKRKLTEFESDFVRKRADLERQDEELSQHYENEKNHIEREAQDKRRELQDLQQRIEELEAYLDGLESRSRLQEQVNELRDEKAADLELLENERAQRKRAERAAADLEQQNAQLLSEQQQRQQQQQRAEPSKRPTADASTAPDPQDSADGNDAQDTISALQAELDDARTAKMALQSRFDEEQARFQEEHERAQGELAALREQAHSSQYGDQHEELAQLQEKLAKAQEDLVEAHATLESAQRDHAEESRRAETQLENAQSAADDAQERARLAEAQHISDAAVHEKELERLNALLGDAKAETSEALKHSAALEESLAQAEADTRQAETDKRNVEASLKALEEARANLETRCSELEGLVETTRNDGEQSDANASRDEALRDLESKLHAARTSLVNERATARSERNALEDKISAARHELERARERAKRNDTTSASQYNDLRDKLAATEKRCIELEQEIRAAHEAHDEKIAKLRRREDAETTRLDTALAEAESAREQALKDVAQLHEEMQASRAAFAREKDALRAQLERAETKGHHENQEQVATAKAREQELSERLEAALRNAEELDAKLRGSEERHKKDLAAAQNERERLRDKMDALVASSSQGENDEWTQQVQSALREAAELREEKTNLCQQLSAADEKLGTLETEQEFLRGKLHDAREEAQSMRAETARLKSMASQAAEDADASLGSHHEESLTLQRTIHGLQKSLLALKLEHSQAQDDEAHAQKQLEALEDALTSANRATSEGKRRILALESTQRQLATREADLQAQVVSLQTELDDTQAELLAQTDRIRAQAEKSRRLDKERHSAVAEVEELRERIRDLEESAAQAPSTLTRSQASEVERHQRRLETERAQLEEDRRTLDKERRKVEESAKTVKRQLVQLEDRFRVRKRSFSASSAALGRASRSSPRAPSFAAHQGDQFEDHRPTRQEALDAAEAWQRDANDEKSAIASARSLLLSQRQELEAQRARLGEQQDAWRELDGPRPASVGKLGSVLEAQEDELTDALRDLSRKLTWLQTMQDLHEEVSRCAERCVGEEAESAHDDSFFRVLEEYRADEFLATQRRRRARVPEVDDEEEDDLNVFDDDEQDGFVHESGPFRARRYHDGDEHEAFGVTDVDDDLYRTTTLGDENDSVRGNAAAAATAAAAAAAAAAHTRARVALHPGMGGYAYPVFHAGPPHAPHAPYHHPVYMAASRHPGSNVVYVNENGQILQEAAPPVMPVPRRRPFKARQNQNHVESGYQRSEGPVSSAHSYSMGPEASSSLSPATMSGAHEVSVLPEELRLMESRWSEQRALAQEHSQWLMNFRRDLERVSSIPSSETSTTSSAGSQRRGLKARRHRRSHGPISKHDKPLSRSSRRPVRSRLETKI
ncbi:Centrosomal protein of 164 kDa [Hondaea fermentalgiana]|uniref:Centrosomal protein of 164 kDa n=1 Tax=Hondaea fermentalgiana TaxID=2315210 RepID=A0A2R5G5T3_9STRA|nr:Centrosomal protein of 164 kDa [Hondaea fermentalgiana]|eukprot:GBG26350.1 Centrosomal protein of 164 kDa [Hondaea fermentalgiana]